MDKTLSYYINKHLEIFKGWDFSFVNGRIVSEPLNWSYYSSLIPFILNSKCMLDMGTGGGEFLSSLPIPKTTYATEQYKPNIPIAKSRLEKIGVRVVEVSNDILDGIEDNFFDLIINRHESFDINEVTRVLKPHGFFITQQVGDKDFIELNNLLNAPINSFDNWNLNSVSKILEDNHFRIDTSFEDVIKTKIFDIGAILFYLNAIPWQIENFYVENYKNQLEKIHDEIMKNGFIEVQSHRFFIISQLNN